MKWYKIYLNGENRIWKKCITYSWEFIYEDKEINFQRIIDSSSSERYQIKALITVEEMYPVIQNFISRIRAK